MWSAGPVSAFAARKARQQLAQNVTVVNNEAESLVEPPYKRLRQSPTGGDGSEAVESESCGSRTRSSKPDASKSRLLQKKLKRSSQAELLSRAPQELEKADDGSSEDDSVREREMSQDEVASVARDPDGYEIVANIPEELQNFNLSRTRLKENNIVYSEKDRLCVRIKEKMVWLRRLYMDEIIVTDSF